MGSVFPQCVASLIIVAFGFGSGLLFQYCDGKRRAKWAFRGLPVDTPPGATWRNDASMFARVSTHVAASVYLALALWLPDRSPFLILGVVPFIPIWWVAAYEWKKRRMAQRHL